MYLKEMLGERLFSCIGAKVAPRHHETCWWNNEATKATEEKRRCHKKIAQKKSC